MKIMSFFIRNKSFLGALFLLIVLSYSGFAQSFLVERTKNYVLIKGSKKVDLLGIYTPSGFGVLSRFDYFFDYYYSVEGGIGMFKDMQSVFGVRTTFMNLGLNRHLFDISNKLVFSGGVRFSSYFRSFSGVSLEDDRFKKVLYVFSFHLDMEYKIFRGYGVLLDLEQGMAVNRGVFIDNQKKHFLFNSSLGIFKIF